MADYNLNHNIFEGRSTGGAAGKPTSGGIDGTKVVKEIGNVMGKASKELNKSFTAALRKELEPLVRQLLKGKVAQGPAAKSTDKPITRAEITRIVKNVSEDTAKTILSQSAKGSRGGDLRSVESVIKNMDSHLVSAFGKLTTSISSKSGIEIGAAAFKPVADSVGKVIKENITKELNKTLQEANKAFQSVQRGADTTTQALKAISKIKSPKGGINLSEVGNAGRALKELGKEAKDLAGSYKELKNSAKNLAKGQVDVVKKLATAVDDAKTKLSKQVQSVRAIPGQLKDTAVGELKKAQGDFVKELKQVTKEVISGTKSGKQTAATPTKELKQLDSSVKDNTKGTAKLTKAVENLYKKPTTATGKSTTDNSKKLDTLNKKMDSVYKNTKAVTTTPNKPLEIDFSEIIKVISDIRKESRTELANITKAVDAGTKDESVLTAFMADRDALIKALDKLKPTEIKEAAGRVVTGGYDKLLVQLRELINAAQKQSGTSPQEFDKAFSDAAKNIEDAVSQGIKKAVEEATARPKSDPTRSKTPGQPDRDISLLIKDIQLMNSRLRGPASVNVYPEAPLPATKGGLDLKFEGSYGKGQEKQKQLIQNRINDLSSSLFELQDYIVTTINEEFKNAGNRWSIVKDGTEKGIQDFFKLVKGGNVKESGKQHAFQIANTEAISKQLFLKGRGAATKGTPASMVRDLTDAIATELASNFQNPSAMTGKIAEWLKTVTSEQIKQIKEIERFQSDFINIKKIDPKGVLPSAELIKKLHTTLGGSATAGPDKSTLEAVFKATVGKTEATKTLKEQKLIRTVSLPAARLTKTGTPVFETSKGSQRALQRFAEFKTGFEQLYEDLAKEQSLIYSKGFAERIKTVGVKPSGIHLDEAQNLAEEILSDFAKVNKGNLIKLREHIGKATTIKYAAVGDTAGGELIKKVNEALAANENVLADNFDPGAVKASVDPLIKNIKAAGLSMYDVVKSMDKLKFLNVYDVMKQVLEGKAGGPQPLKDLGEKPGFDKYIREFETAQRQLVQTLPIVEPGRPRRGFQQENVLNLFSRTSDIFSREKKLKPEEQKDFIKDLNIRFNEMIRDAAITNEKILSEGIRTISTIGIPESLAGKVETYRPGKTDPGTKYLGALDAFSTKMYTDILPELAPFGAQFTQTGRNVAGITNAMSASKTELDRLAKEFKATTLEGYGTEFPGVRTERESGLISAGRLGTKGFGFNVLTEIRHTAGTMEDQILVSGNMAKALTSITKTLVRPSPGGRLGGNIESAIGIGEIQTGTVKDQDISNVLDKIQEVLGVPEQYKGRADQAFIDEVRKAITVVRGEEIEVQQARITEVFLNSFGRKLTTRYGSKGVSVTPGGLGEEEIGEVGKILKAFPKAKVKVLTEKEREKAGLGVAVLPRSMGELLSEILDKYQKQLESEDFDVVNLKKMLIASGNKFVLGMFKDAEKAIVVEEEATQQRGVFDKAAGAFEAITGQRLEGDKAAIQQIRDLFTKEIGGGTVKERAIDVRISSVGIGKRGLQPEVLEAVLSNIAGTGERGFTTVPTRFEPEQYKGLLGGGGLSQAAGSLGFETAGTKAEIKSAAEALGVKKGDKDMVDIITKRAQALEEASNYYTTVIDEFGKERKSIVGEKFLSVVQDPGETEPWKKTDINRGIKGASVDIPVFSAYATVFGEQSKLMEEIAGTTNANQRKQLELLKALQFMADETGTFQGRQLQYLDQVNLNAVKYFDASTGILSDQAGALDPRSLKDTVFDVKKFPKPFFLDIPKTAGEPGETEPFYVPGALARGTYSEELVGGERGIEDTGRRLQQVVNMAQRATELLDRPAAIQDEINNLEEELSKLLTAGDPRAAQVETKLSSRKTAQIRLLSGDSELSNTVRREVTNKIGELLKEAQTLKYDASPDANAEVKKIYEVITNALSKVEAPAGAFAVKRFGEGQTPLATGASEADNVAAFLERQKGIAGKSETAAYVESIGKASDLLIGKGPGAVDIYNTILKGIAELQQGKVENIGMFKEVLEKDPAFKKQLTGDPSNILSLLQKKQGFMAKEMKATEDKLYRLANDIQKGEGLNIAAKLGIDVDKELQHKYEKALDNLTAAKISYFHSLAEKAVGKEGAIGTAVFSRKFPAVMKKATNAIVDRTEEFKMFEDTLKSLKGKLPENEMSKIDDVLTGIGSISAKHGKKIAKQRESGFPVLKQHEIGVPEVTAKKLPFTFEKRFDFDKKGELSAVRASFKEIDATLYDYLKYIENLNNIVTSTDDEDLKNLASSELKDVGGQSAVEAIRYPFTGVSSIVPYEAKLLEGKKYEKSFSVPGAPGIDLDKFSETISPIQEIISGLSEQRNMLFKEADVSRQPVDKAKIKELTGLMDELARAVANVTPKYAAHTAKLDFDGDEIAVHTAKTREARKEIEDHYKSVISAEKGYQTNLQEVYRDVFTSDALKSQQPTGELILAEQAEDFYKKFPKEKGFDYLVKPFLTGQAVAGEKSPALEYASQPEQLSILGLGDSITSTLKNIIQDTIQGPQKEDFVKLLEPFAESEESLKGVKEAGGIEGRITFSEDIYKAIEELDDQLSTSFVDEIKNAVTSRLFESKYRDAVEAQLFKIHTGIETEALYRLNRLAEANVGFGKGFAGTGGAVGKPSEGFAERNPALGILGGDVQSVSEDFFAKFNEVFRFALQKGMDVKHAGGQTIAGVIERNIAGAGEGVTGLWNSIIDENNDTFKELKQFSDVVNKTSRVRLGEMPTADIRKELGQLYEARNQDYSPAELATSDRDDIIDLAVEATGLKSFFEEMSTQVREAAIAGIIKQVSTLSPEKRSRIGDPETYAKGLVSEELSSTGINVREHITMPNLPLYTARQESGLYKQQERFEERHGEVGVPENIKLFKKSTKETEDLLNKFKLAKATARNIQDAMEESAKGLGGGAYGALVKSTLENIRRDQKIIETEFDRLGDFVPPDTQAKDYLSDLADRVNETRDIPSITEEILKMGPQAQAERLGELSDLVGIPSVTKEEKLDLSGKLFKGFRKEGEALHAQTPGLSLDDINERAAEYAQELVDTATVIYEMDRILDVLTARAQEGITLLSLFPETGTAGKTAGTKPGKSYDFASKMKDISSQGQASSEILKSLYGPNKAGTIGGGGAGGAGGAFSTGGGVVPVHIHSIAQGIGLSFGGGGGAPTGGLTEELNPEFGPQQRTQAAVAELRSQIDQHGEAAIKELQKKFKSGFKPQASGFDRHKGKFDTEAFKDLQKKYFPGQDPADYEEFKKKFFTNLLNVFTGSKFKAGGSTEAISKKAAGQGDLPRFEAQIDAIIGEILGTGGAPDESTQAAFDIGTALHEKFQKRIKDQAAAAGKSGEVEIEKFVYVDPKEYISGVKGVITGFIDVAYKNAEGQIEKISDIKTTGETFAKFESLTKIIPEEGIELEELLNKKMPDHIRQKLEDYRTQLNVYLAGLIREAKDPTKAGVAPNLKAEIAFIPSEDTELKTPPRVVSFSFDEARLKQDLEALKIARETVSKYITNVDTELKDVPEDVKPLVEKYRKSGKTAAKPARTLESFQLEEELDKLVGVTELSDEFINEYVDLSRKVFKFMEGKGGVYTETRKNFEKATAQAKAAGQTMSDNPDYDIDPSRIPTPPRGPLPGGPSKEKVKSFTEPLKEQFQAIQELHQGSVILQTELSGLDFGNDIEKMHQDIKAVLGKGKKPPSGPEFAEVMKALTEGDFINFQESMKAWRLWRIAMGDFLINQAKEAEQAFDLANLKGPATSEFSVFKQSVERLVGDQGFIRNSLGKKSDIYTKDRRFLMPDTAEKAGVFASSEEIYRKSAQPFGEDETTKGIYKDLKDKLEAGTLGAPADTIRDLVEQMANLDREAQAVLEDVDLFERMGKDATEAWDFDTMAKRASVLREALSQYMQLNLSDQFQVDVEKKFQVRSLLQYLKQIEQVYGRIDLSKVKKGPFGEYETGAVKVPGFLPPGQQQALHRRNIQKFRDFAERPAAGGEEGENKGPRVGESFSYFSKVTDEAGNVLKNVRVDFKKYAEVVDDAGVKVGKFSERQVDLIDKMQMSGGTFQSAAKRVVMWGAAATLVYGGVQALTDSVGELADIEVGLAQLRMVMNPLETDFDSLTKSAVGFAKSYGVGVKEVIGSMKIFAQQGLKQSEVINRTRVSTLASNVTTLSASDATEALTATMKVFGNEIGSADMALDAWSETEARHAITAADMANAIKKSAAAAKNAGFTFNELNGIVAGIGAVTRQTGKEVGTAMRFIARRIFSEKGPKSLAEINIPTVTGTGENRRGFDILSDLSMKWGELTNAQKLNTAQSLGGTRQYNALLVAMDNWDEVLEAIEDSTNSKGSAERRNVEIMKTYAKQLEQTKAAATELKLELGKFIFPVFKVGLKAFKIMFELMAAIPAPVKAAGVALTLFFGYASKGLAIFDKLNELVGRGKGVISSFIGSISKEFDTSKFEIFGKGFGDPVKGLKTFAKGAPDLLKATGLNDLHSGFGKLVFLIKDAGDSYNKFLATAGKGADQASGGIEAFGKKVKDVSKIVDGITDVFQLVGLETAPFVAIGTQIVESLAKGTGVAIEQSGKLFGKTGRKIAEFMSEADPGLFKSIAPMAASIGVVVAAFGGMSGAMDRSRKSAQEYAQSVYNLRRIEEDQVKELTHVTRKYDRLEQRIKKINKVLATPGLKGKQQASNNYTAPLLALASVQEDATKLSNELAQVNNKLVIGYDAQGDAILKLTGNYKSYIESLQSASSLELAKTDIDVLKKYVEALTDTGFGETIKSALKTALGEIPALGGVLEGLISVSPGKEMEVLVEQINELFALREQSPLSDAFDQDISKLQDSLGKVKKIYDETANDFKRTLAGIFKFEGAQGLDRDTIARLLSDEGLRKGFELLIEIEPKIAEVNRTRMFDKVKSEDVVGSEILKRIFPEKKAFIDYTSELTAAQLESSGIMAREGKKVAGGDVVTFFPEMARLYNIAGAQAVVELKKTTDGVYEAFITYINSKTLKVEEKALDDPDLMRMVDRIFPSGKIQSELENRLDALNTFVAGAAAGLVGIEPKKFKKDFDLGSRFYSEVPTTTALQADKGFNVQTNQFGPLPRLQQEWARMTKDFFIEPMGKYNREVESLSKNTLDGLGETAQLTKQKADELYDQQAILRNNQVIAQFAAVFADLSKSMEESSRVLKENLAVEKSRQEAVRVTTGLLKGVPEGFDAIDTGIRKIQDLSVKQLAAITTPRYRDLAGAARTQQVTREGAIGELDSLEKTKVAIKTIFATQSGLGSIIGPEAGPKAVEGFIQKAAAIQDVGMATLSQDINNLDTTSRKGFGDVVDRLESMIANQGDFGSYLEEIDRLTSRVDRGFVGDQDAGLVGGKIAQEMHRLAGQRQFARAGGDARSVGVLSSYIDQLTDLLVRTRGVSGGAESVRQTRRGVGVGPSFSTSGRYTMSPEEFQQRAFRRLQSNELVERFKTEGTRSQRGGLLGALNPKVKAEFTKSSEYKELIKLQAEANKLQEKSLLDSKTILKGSIAIATFEAFNKQHSSKVLDTLKEQLTKEELALSKATPGSNIPEMEKNIESLNKAIVDQEKNLKFHGLVSSMTKITGGTTALGKALGVSETNLKRMNVGAIGLYIAMQAATKVTGKDMPESAKEFGGVLKDAVGELKKGGDLKDIGLKLRKAGGVFEEAYGESVKEATGKTRAAIDKQINERLKGMKDLSQAEIDERAKQLRKEAGSGGGAGVGALLSATAAATLAGTFYELSGSGTDNAERVRLAEKTSAVFDSIIKKYPEAADLIAQELVKQVQDQAKEAGGAAVDSAPQNQLLDTTKEYNNAMEFLDGSIEKTKKTIEDTANAFDGLADQMHGLEVIVEINKSMRDFVMGLTDAATEFEVARKFGGAAILNKSLVGFAGDAELPTQTRQMSTQQRLFSTMGDDFQGSVTSYSYGLQTINSLVDKLGEATKRRREFIENNIEDPEVWESLEREIDATKESLNDATDTLRPFGDALNNIVQYADTVNKLNDAFNDIAAKQAIETLPGFRQYRDDMDKLLGGSHPDAAIGITPEQERMARGVGVQLRQGESTRYDLERAQLLDQRRKSSGGEGLRINQRLSDLPEARRRDIESYRQRTSIGSLREQQAPFEQALTDVQQLRQRGDLTDDVDEALVEYQNAIVTMLKRSAESVSRAELSKEVIEAGRKPIFGIFGKAKISQDQMNAELQRIAEGGPKQFRGTLVTGQADIEKKRVDVFEELRRQLPTREMSELKVAIAEPIVRELEYQSNILKLIADQGLGIDNKFFDEVGNVVKPFEAQPYGDKGFFDKLLRILSPFGNRSGASGAGVSLPSQKPGAFDSERRRGAILGSAGVYDPKTGRGTGPASRLTTEKRRTVPPTPKAGAQWYEDYYKWITDKFGYDVAERKASGGRVFGEGGPREDKVPAMLSPGEFVIKQSAASKLGLSNLEHINKYGEIPKFADGGPANGGVAKKPYDELKGFMGPISTITGKKIPTAAENVEGSVDAMKAMVSFVVDNSKALAKYMYGNLMNSKDPNPEVPFRDTFAEQAKEFDFFDRSVIDAPKDLEAMMVLGEIDPPGIGGIKKATLDFGRKARWKEPLQKILQSQKNNPLLTSTDELVKATGLSKYEVSTLQEMLAGNVPKTSNILSKITKPLRNQIGSVGPGVDDLSKKIPLIKHAEKKSVEFADIYPDVFQKVKGGKAKFRDIDRFAEDPSVGGSFLSRTDPAENLTRPVPYEIALNKKILDVKNPGNIATVINHEGFHAVAQYVKDKFAKTTLDTNIIDKQLKAQNDFINSFAKRKPFTKIAEAKVGESKFGSENFAEFARSVHQGHIKSKLSAEFNELFDPKFFQTGEAFAEGGAVGLGAGGRIKRRHFAEGGLARKFTTRNGELVEVDADGKVVKTFGKQEQSSFLKNKAYRVGTGEVDIELPRTRTPAMFAEETASLTGRRLGEEATALHTAKQKLSKEEIMAAEIAKVNREVKRQKEQDPAVREALRFPGLRGDTGELGLSNLTFDKRSGSVGDKSIGKKFQSYHDLRELDFQDMKTSGADIGMIGQIQAIARGMAATAGQDPIGKIAFAKEEARQKELKAKMQNPAEILPGSKLFNEVGTHYGREAELLLPIYHKLRAMQSMDEDADPKIFEQFEQAGVLLRKGAITDPADMKILSRLVEADKKGAFMSAPDPTIKSDLVRKYIEQAKTAQDYQKIQKLMETMDLSPEQARKFSETLGASTSEGNLFARSAKSALGGVAAYLAPGFKIVSDVRSAGDVVDDANKKELAKFSGSPLGSVVAYLNPGLKLGADALLSKKADGGSIPFYQSGGLIPKSGPIYAHKGEVVIPAGFAEGGLVENSSATAALKEGTIKLEDNGLADKIAEKIKEAIETSEVKIEEGAIVKVDVTDVSVPVDIGDSKIQVDTTNVTVGVDSGQSTIPVDVSAAADAIGDAISRALESATVDVNVNQTGGGAVGADGIDELSRAVSSLDDRLLEVKDTLEVKIEAVRTGSTATVQTEISAQVERAMTRVQQDVNEHTNRLSHVNSQITRFEHQMDSKIREVDRIARDAQNFATRPPAPVTLI